ncbi:MAG: hypothetical protein ABSB36_02275 [Candidatus Dormibacteria bacterium]|jgi:hypothetical protein
MEMTSAAASEPPKETEVRGTVDLVTERPIVLPRQDGPRARIEDFLGRRPLLVPAVLLGIVALLLLRRGPRIVVVRPQSQRDS